MCYNLTRPNSQWSSQRTWGLQNYLCCQVRYFSNTYRPTISSHLMKIVNLSRVGMLGSRKQHQNIYFIFIFFFFPKFASKVAPRVAPKYTTKAVSLVPPSKIPKAFPFNFPIKHPISVPNSHLVVSLWLYIFGIYCS